MANLKKVLVTGSGGLIGSQSVNFFAERGFNVVGIDNDMRSYFFGQEASTKDICDEFKKSLLDRYAHYSCDIRDYSEIEDIFKNHKFDLIIHTAAQPSHDWAAREPLTDFSVNANGTLNLLENARKFSPDAVFIFTSTNKVYGDAPNSLPLVEEDTRWEIETNHPFYQGIDETMSIDNSTHSIFGASKVAADILVQEYGRYFSMKTASFRGGCLTGPMHKGAELHGFLAYLAKCVMLNRKYTVYGYQGKQVRDNIHCYDLVNCFWHFYQNPRCGEVYNIGGSRHSNISMKEAITYFEKKLNKKSVIEYSQTNRVGDHIWYISDVSKFKTHYPKWEFKYDIYAIMDEICLKNKV
ncbi:MAG: NAD-dependent epimerase/dehydratase family protein [Candidatus Omnitrophica bacterium]|nr:NAD-dependent epimerase/dehydratase family protein [Candidatus Omnitrophota bacterium]